MTVHVNERSSAPASRLIPGTGRNSTNGSGGYGTTNIKDLTGSVSSIGERTLSQLNVPNASQMLQNLAAGVQVSSGTGVPGETLSGVRVRGATSLTGSNEPLSL